MSAKKPISFKKIIVYSVSAILVVLAILVGAASVGNRMASREAEKMAAMAAEGGFESVQEFKAAKAIDIFTKAEYDAYVAQRDNADKAAAEQGGFLSVDEYKKAQYVNMPTKVLYDKYLEQQAELKLAVKKRKADEAEKERLAVIDEKKRKADEAEKERLAAIDEEKRKADEEDKSKITSRPTSLLLKCVDKDGFYFINHAEDNSTADFLYVKSGDRFSRNEFYNVFNTRLVVRDLVYIYPNFKFNVQRSYNYRKWSMTIQRDTGVLRADYESRNPLYKPDVSGSREFYRSGSIYNCNVSSDHEIFFTLKEDYLSYLNTKEKEKSEKLIEDKNNRLKNKKL